MTANRTETLGAYLDGALDPAAAARVEALMERDPTARAEFDALARQDALIGEAAAALDTGPASLRTAALERQLAERLARPNPARRFPALPGWSQQAAAAAAMAVLGWWGHAAFVAGPAALPDYVSEAVGAHGVFAHDTEHAAEFTGDALAGAIDWFSQKMGTDIAVPDLGSAGMQVVGARLLGTREGPLVQFIYEDDTGNRFSLALARHPDDAPLHPVEIATYPDSRVGYWRGAQLDYAVVGEAPGEALQQIAMLVSEER